MLRRLLPILIIGLSTCTSLFADYPAGYYDKMDGTKRETLKKAAKQCIKDYHVTTYSDLPIAWEFTDVYPDLVNGMKRWWDMYSDNMYLIAGGQTAKQSFSANSMQREHSVPKSWWKKNEDVEYTPAYSDLWNLFPSDGPANLAKNNYPLGICATTTFDNGVTKVGRPVSGYGGGASTVFEPDDEYKGDFARSFFYMATLYDDLPWAYTYMFQTQEWPTLKPWAYEMLLEWARKDPVSQKERDRNEAVYLRQGNRNPFVDFPYLAEYVWGELSNNTFYLAEQGGEYPEVTGPAILYPENGSEIIFEDTPVATGRTRQIPIAGNKLEGYLSVKIEGTNASSFTPSVLAFEAARTQDQGGYLLGIKFSPQATGIHTATLVLSGGGLPTPTRVTLTGEAFPMPVLAAVTALEAENISATSYDAVWTPSDDKIDSYVLTRTRYLEDGPQSMTYKTTNTRFTISDREANVAESYYVQTDRMGILSGPSNTMTVDGSAGMDLKEVQPLTLLSLPGGFVISLNDLHHNLKVFDIAGRQVIQKSVVSGGEEFFLPSGIYILITDENTRPIKIVVR